MARSDLLVKLIRSSSLNDKVLFRKTVEAIIAEERSKGHSVLAERLEEVLNITPDQGYNGKVGNNGHLLDQRTCNLFFEIIPKRKISDLILPEEVKQICHSLTEEQHRYELLRSYNLEPRNRILLIGPPGNGKTSLAEGIAEALMVPYIIVRYESVVGTYLGETAVRLKKLFEYVSTRRCVLFFDEFETLGKERGDVHETGEIKRVVSSLLMQIDNLPSHVMVITATNHPELLDRAVWRRFQVRMELPAPNQSGLIKWFEQFEKRIDLSLDYDISSLAKKLAGSSYSEVEEFGMTVFREYVLQLPDVKVKAIVVKTLQSWSSRSVKVVQSQHHDVVNL